MEKQKRIMWNFDTVKAYYAEHGCQLLATEYKNGATKMPFICKCGIEHSSSFESFKQTRRCYKCGKESGAHSNRVWNTDKVTEFLAEHNCILLSEFIDHVTPFNFTCSCGGDGLTTLPRFRDGVRCNGCRKTRAEEKAVRKYGFNHVSKTTAWKENQAKSNMEKYGVTNVFQSEIIKNKIKENNKEKYGVEYTAQVDIVKEKIKATNLEKYGVEVAAKSDVVKEKMKNTSLERYGVECPAQTPENRKKVMDNNIVNHGVSHTILRPEVREKSKKTVMEKYGVENVMQNMDIRHKARSSMTNIKTWNSPSGRTFQYQGYEIHAIQKLIADGMDENNILTEKDLNDIEMMPEIYYELDGKKRRYYPDIYLVDENTFIEVKSTWTLNLQPDKIKVKLNRLIEMGYGAELWVYNDKKILVDKQVL
jgi:hypothetical protein